MESIVKSATCSSTSHIQNTHTPSVEIFQHINGVSMISIILSNKVNPITIHTIGTKGYSDV